MREESFHIRSRAPGDVLRLLRDDEHAGLLFPPESGWLTFVPYAGSRKYREHRDGLARALNRILDVTVVHFLHDEARGWQVILASNGADDVRFAHWWDGTERIERDRFDAAPFAPFAPADVIQGLLKHSGRRPAGLEPSAHRFARLIGLSRYARLSPEIVEEKAGDFVRAGAKTIGVRPRESVEGEVAARLPVRHALEVPRSDLSALEAFEIVRPRMAPLEQAWPLGRIFGASIEAGGRLTQATSWNFNFYNGARTRYQRVALWSNGALFVSEHDAQDEVPGVLLEPGEFPTWLDSDIIALVAQRFDLPPEIDPAAKQVMTLQQGPAGKPVWTVSRSSTTRSEGGVSRQARVEWVIDAAGGTPVSETVEVRDVQKVDRRQRIMSPNGEWRKVVGS